MRKFLLQLVLILALGSCSNTPELETGEIKTLQLLTASINQLNNPKVFVNSRKLLDRKQIDAARVPVLFVELASGQNGTLTPYPGQGVGQTWLGADGATITLDRGVLKASRGMGHDLMGSSSSMPQWSQIGFNNEYYERDVGTMTGNNKIFVREFDCKVKKNKQQESINIWDVEFHVTKFEEACNSDGFEINNTYYLEDLEIVRKSLQYHSKSIGYIITERLDR